MLKLDEAQIQQFLEEGFLIVPKVFECDAFNGVVNEINQMIDEIAFNLVEKGIIKDVFSSSPFLTRLIQLESVYPGFSVQLHTMAAGKLRPELAKLMGNELVLDIVQNLFQKVQKDGNVVYPDIGGHPEWNIRCKVPKNILFDVPWHQDTAYLESGNENYQQITLWIPLVDVSEFNGTLQIIKNSPKKDRDSKNFVYSHHIEKNKDVEHKESWYVYIKDEDLPLDRIVTCNIHKGDAVFFTNLTPHRSLPNRSHSIRWTIDFRYMKIGDPSGFSGLGDKCIPLRTKENRQIPIDLSVWGSEPILMGGSSDKDKEKASESDHAIEGPWLERWIQKPS
eukprot:TRINITY_DN4360_c0_g1_i1.p1 TRINITY_DN4360_c0_g1~~TRINITY_DN4360_c0_g1_i1.p1  ORF type:complete len:353 (+),score=73.01 TRINITY_DN4360_c0_g1_i1:54-1061(+)